MKKMLKNCIAALVLISIITTGSGVHAATNIGTGSVVGNPAFDTSIIWDDNFPGTASGSVVNIPITARVLPSLNMEISSDLIALGDLVSGVTSSGSLNIEVGTNAATGVSVTARSSNAGLTNTSDPTVQINALTTDGLAESYTWQSTPNAVDDSSNGSYTSSGLSEVEITSSVTEHVVYSTNRPESQSITNDDVEFIVSANIDAETPAGDYEDFVTFTITGNF